MRNDAYIELARRAKSVTYVNLGVFDSAAHPRAAAGASGGTGGQFIAGQSRDKQSEAANKDKAANANATALQNGKLDPLKMNDKDLQALAAHLYSFKTSDPKIVAMRIKVANALAKRGMDVKKYGAKGGGITEKKVVAAAKKAPAKAPAKKVVAKKAAPKKQVSAAVLKASALNRASHGG